jgi:hypothetical protein
MTSMGLKLKMRKTSGDCGISPGGRGRWERERERREREGGVGRREGNGDRDGEGEREKGGPTVPEREETTASLTPVFNPSQFRKSEQTGWKGGEAWGMIWYREKQPGRARGRGTPGGQASTRQDRRQAGRRASSSKHTGRQAVRQASRQAQGRASSGDMQASNSKQSGSKQAGKDAGTSLQKTAATSLRRKATNRVPRTGFLLFPPVFPTTTNMGSSRNTGRKPAYSPWSNT